MAREYGSRNLIYCETEKKQSHIRQMAGFGHYLHEQ